MFTKLTRRAAAAAVLGALPALAQAEIVRVPSAKPVAETADAFVAALDPAGITVFARIDHGAGAVSVGSDIGASELIVFGSPEVGTPALVDNRLAGLALPLRVLVYEDAEGEVWLAFEDPSAMLAGFDGIAADAPYVARMTGALAKLTARAAE